MNKKPIARAASISISVCRIKANSSITTRPCASHSSRASTKHRYRNHAFHSTSHDCLLPLICSRCRCGLGACIGHFQVCKPLLHRLRATLEGEQSSDQTHGRDPSTDPHVDVENVDIRLPNKQLIHRRETEDSGWRSVKVIQLRRGQHTGERFLNLLVEHDETRRDANATAEDPQLCNDSLRNGCGSRSVSNENIGQGNCH